MRYFKVNINRIRFSQTLKKLVNKTIKDYVNVVSTTSRIINMGTMMQKLIIFIILIISYFSSSLNM